MHSGGNTAINSRTWPNGWWRRARTVAELAEHGQSLPQGQTCGPGGGGGGGAASVAPRQQRQQRQQQRQQWRQRRQRRRNAPHRSASLVCRGRAAVAAAQMSVAHKCGPQVRRMSAEMGA
jgi:hypothetical protein